MHYSLKNFQKDFLASLKDKNSSDAFLQGVIPSVKMLNKKKPLQVYQNGYYVRLTEALGETFEACWWILGDEEFFSVCHSFIRAHPSSHYNLSEYGREFPEFLYNHNLSKEIPFLFDLAHFEWAFKILFHCRQHKSFENKNLSFAKDPGDFKIKFGSAFFLFHSEYSIYYIWKKRKEEQDGCSLDFDRDDFLILYKKSNKIFIETLNEKEFFLLKNLKQGYSLSQALDQQGLLLAEEISNIFQRMVNRGIIIGLDFVERVI